MKPKSNSNSWTSLLGPAFTSSPRAQFAPVLKRAARKALIGHPSLYRACSAAYSFVRFLPIFVKRAIGRRSGTHTHDPVGDAQAILNWPVNLPNLHTWDQVLEWLEHNGIRFKEAGHIIYIPPQENLARCLGTVVEFYPDGTGFKILKNLGSATDVDYIHGHRGGSLRRSLLGSLTERLLAANYLHIHNIGPRVWDLSTWNGNGTDLAVFAVEHVNGREAQREDSVAFIEKLSRMVEMRSIEILEPNWQESLDFSLPSCNHNLLYCEKRDCFLYVDFQNFGIPDHVAAISALCDEKTDALHFGSGRFFRDQRYLYQSVPAVTDGKRDIVSRWGFVKSHLANAGISVDSRIVLDVGCNAGMMLNMALREGALWGFGWDLPPVTKSAEDLLLMLGSTRFTLTGVQMDESYFLEDDIPEGFAPYLDESVVFYLSVSNQLGYLQSLYRMPWRVLVYEGHQDHSESDIANAEWANFGPDVELVAQGRSADGDSLPRPFAVFLRRSSSHRTQC